MHEIHKGREKAVAVSIVRKGSDRRKALEYLDELEFLADTAGVDVVEKVYQELEHLSSATMMGKGKLQELKLTVEEEKIELVIFDDELSPAQARNLEKELNIKVLDRSGLILDIFASRAKSNEAITQVELAQLQYLLPRLTRLWTHLSKQYGGVGTKGPGETQIETDRRLVKNRISILKDKLEQISSQQEQQRKSREGMPRFALVGYTNAGKSTLMNTLTSAGVYVEDKLFATLDTTVRGFLLPSGRKALLSDTVGFIRKLPTHLVASFRSTLAEAGEADVLIHIVDISHLGFKEQIKAVEDTLHSLKIIEKPVILVFNKIDMLENREGLRALEEEYPNSIFVSAKRGLNIQKLLETMQTKYEENSTVTRILLPYESMGLIAQIYSSGEIVKRTDKDEGIELEICVDSDKSIMFENKFGKYFVV